MIGATEQYRLPAFADATRIRCGSTAQELDMPVHFHNVAGAKRLNWYRAWRQRYEDTGDGQRELLRPVLTDFANLLLAARSSGSRS